MFIRAGVVTFAALLAALATAGRAADDYEIRLQRPFKAGVSFTVSATDTLRSSETVDLPNGMSNQSSLFRRVTLDADVRIDKVDDQGAPTGAAVVIRRLTVQTGNGSQAALVAPKVVLEPGTAVTLTYNGGQPVFALKAAAALSDEGVLALQQAFERMGFSDAVYGTKERKKAGESWPLNTSALAGDKTNPQNVDPALISGTVTFKGVRTLAGIACVQIDSTMTAKDYPVQGAAAKEATMTEVFSAVLPTDGARPVVAWSKRSTTHLVTEEKPLGQGTMRRTVDSEVLHEAAWLPKS